MQCFFETDANLSQEHSIRRPIFVNVFLMQITHLLKCNLYTFYYTSENDCSLGRILLTEEYFIKLIY